MGKPEEFLALIESLSSVRDQQLQSFSAKLDQLTDKELRKIYKSIYKATRDGQISEYDLDQLLVRLYRITYNPKGLISTSIETKSLQQAFDKLDDQIIKERVAITLYRDGMIGAFDLLIKEPNLKTRFLIVLERSKPWLDVGLAAGLWTSTVALQMATGAGPMDLNGVLMMLPPYLPSLNKFMEVNISEQEKQILITKGPEAGFENIERKNKGLLQKGRHWKYFRSTYLLSFSILITSSVSLAVYDNSQLARQAEQKVAYEKTHEMVDDYVAESKMAPEQRGEADFLKFVAYCEANGLKVDVNSPEMQEERKKRIAAFVEAAKIIKPKSKN